MKMYNTIQRISSKSFHLYHNTFHANKYLNSKINAKLNPISFPFHSQKQSYHSTNDLFNIHQDISNWNLDSVKDIQLIKGHNVETMFESYIEGLSKRFDSTSSRLELFHRCQNLFANESSLLKISRLNNNDKTKTGRIIVVGDVHGQFHDVLQIFQKFGMPSRENIYLFNGDLVDRGKYSVEIVTTLFALKLANPESIFINRGNHETAGINLNYGLKRAFNKFPDATLLYNACNQAFNQLPFASVIDDEIFVVHGGVAEFHLADIATLSRGHEPEYSKESWDLGNPNAIIEILLWSDPREKLKGYALNNRGAGLYWGEDITKKFLKLNNLKLVIRSHEVVDEGFQKFHNNLGITLFSAPAYCGLKNKGAVAIISNETNTTSEAILDCLTIHQFEEYKNSMINI